MFYRIEDNKIIDCGDFKYADDCLETNEKIVRGFDGGLYFEEETQTHEYQQALAKHEIDMSVSKRVDEIKARLAELSQDFVQVTVGAKIENINDRIIEFQTLHNELRTLEGKEPRDYVSN